MLQDDILAPGTRLKTEPPSDWYLFTLQNILIALVAIVCTPFVFRPVRRFYFRWLEKSQRLKTRRRYGIPDSDTRPFGIAQHAAQILAAEREVATRRAQVDTEVKSRRSRSVHPPLPQPSMVPMPGALRPQPLSNAVQSPPHEPYSLDRYHPAAQHRPPPPIEEEPAPPPEPLRRGPKALDIARAKATTATAAPSPLKRGSKRPPVRDEDDRQSPEKRPRAIGPYAQLVAESDDVQMDDTLPPPTRGMKRVRSETGPAIPEPARARRKGDAPVTQTIPEASQTRGIKRDRLRSDDPSPTKQKRGKKQESASTMPEDESMSSADERESSDVLMPDSSSTEAQISTDTLCGGRTIGEEWEVGGHRFKVGPDGTRLRLEGVKMARSRYSMPADSMHRDTKASMEVVVEKWMSEDEWKTAREAGKLAWQQASEKKPELEVRPNGLELVPANTSTPGRGKQLFYSSGRSSAQVTPSPANPRYGSPMKSTTLDARSNPFEAPRPTPSSTTRRMVSDSPSISRRTSSYSTQTLSKWEKMDREAAALRTMRERMCVPNPPPSVQATTSEPSVPTLGKKEEAKKENIFPSYKPPEAKAETKETARPPTFSFNSAPAQQSVESKPAESKPSFAPAPSAAPSFVFNATSPSSSTTTTAAPKAPTFPPYRTPSSAPTPPAPAPEAAVAPQSKGPFSFGAPKLPASTKPAQSSPLKYSFAPSPASSAPQTPQPQPAAQAASAAPPVNKFSFDLNKIDAKSKPATNESPKASASPFNFGAPKAPEPTQTSTGFAQAGQPTAATSSSTAQPALEKPKTVTQFGFDLSKLNGSNKPAPASQQPKDQPKSSFSFGSPSAEQPKDQPQSSFSFGAPSPSNTAEQPKSAFSFGGQVATPTPPSIGAALGPMKKTPPKDITQSFNFGQGGDPEKKVAEQSKPSFSFEAPSATTGGNGTKSMFGFGGSSSTVAGTTAGSATEGAPKSIFERLGVSPVSQVASTSAEAPKSAFGGFNTASPAANAFALGDAPKSAFSLGGTSLSSSPFGAPASQPSTTFGTGATLPSGNGAPKSSFTFGATPSASTGSADAPKNAFGGFGVTSSTSSGTTEAPKNAFGGFGATSTPAPSTEAPKASFTFGQSGSGGLSSSPFGLGASQQPSQPNLFGTSNTSTALTTPNFTFGAPQPGQAGQASSTAPASNPFSFGTKK